ncbi:MAG: hypothetical protein ACRD1R_04075 [Acidobacteriota bacterium]
MISSRIQLRKIRYREPQSFRHQRRAVRLPQALRLEPARSLVSPAQVIAKPQPGQTVDYIPHTGAILFEWDGEPDLNYVVEYDIGTGDHHASGKY